MQHFREKLPENRCFYCEKTCGNFLKLPQLAMTDGQYYGARKLCHNIATIYCCVCHRPKTLISLARLRRVKYGRFWLLSGRREIGAEIRELPENTGDLATLVNREIYVNWIVHAVSTEDVTGRIEVLKISTPTTTK